MKVRAIENGFFGRFIEAGQVFDVPNGIKGSWFEPFKGKVKAEEVAPPAPPAPPGDNGDNDDDAGNGEQNGDDAGAGNGGDDSLV